MNAYSPCWRLRASRSIQGFDRLRVPEPAPNLNLVCES